MSLESEKIAGMEIDILKIRNRLNKDKITVTHISENSKYRLVIERAASTKGVDGFKVEINGDDFDQVQMQVEALYGYAKDLTNPSIGGNVEK